MQAIGPAVEQLTQQKAALEETNAGLQTELDQSGAQLREALNDANGLRLLHGELRRRQQLSLTARSALEAGQVRPRTRSRETEGQVELAALEAEVERLRTEQQLVEEQLKATGQLKHDLVAAVQHDKEVLERRPPAESAGPGKMRAQEVRATVLAAKTAFLRHDKDCDGLFSEVCWARWR